MALEAVILQQESFGHNCKDLYTFLEGNWSNGFGFDDEEGKPIGSFDDFLDNQTENFLHGNWSSTSMVPPQEFSNSALHPIYHQNSSSDGTNFNGSLSSQPDTSTAVAAVARPKRRRAKSRKNEEEIENQRMTHIAVERNRRKQMNEYLSVLKSLMPDSYVQRGDQASIVGAAINFVKELEHKLTLLSSQKESKEKSSPDGGSPSSPFSEIFTFPVQHSTTSPSLGENSAIMDEAMAETQSAMADIKVSMVESHANLKIRWKRRPPAQLLKLASGLNAMRLTILHLSLTTIDATSLYSISLKVEDDCQLTSVDDIASAVYELLGRIQEDKLSMFSS